ncbi:F0F1 ATP synthase subunit gamma [Alloyangia pacifica]|uniref:F-type H+-transporting ATPase subunit gamma n=1 Tax=Alloyangia pacifica TaxID=311180 RepID=A0A1I6UHG5_9RHOB|nr:FoF1 ATP synthase subunit gamma [Alloyangia pacifica]SDH70307.1 F-type H+-transporting ATPase subunit gamma [Alloyangia pacifica]SFT00916.1 F-type H+-transporting ATPase subunit gamma [Alloyangia pacifica]
MSGTLSDVEARIGTVHKLSAVIAAMRGIAASRLQDAHGHIGAIRLYAGTIGEAIGHALSFSDPDRASLPTPASGSALFIVLCAEQGFAGSFSARVLEAAQAAQHAAQGPTDVLLIGDRGLLVAPDYGIAPSWTAPMIAHPARMPHLAGLIAEVVFERVSDGRATSVSVLHAAPGGTEGHDVVQKRLVPFDYSRFPRPETSLAPRITLPPDELLSRLVEEYIFAEISEALMLSFAAENEARMRAMIAAHDNVTGSLDALVGQARRLRQDAITEEIMELATGSLPAR